MVAESDFQNILQSHNFVGSNNPNTTQITNSDNDDRKELDQNSSGTYQVYYQILSGISDLNALGYYNIGDREYTAAPNGSDVGVTNAYQLDAISYVLNSSTYGVSFADVANINFNSGSSSTSDIIFGSTTSGSDLTSSDSAYEYDVSESSDELKHGDIWLNQDASHVWDSSGAGSAANWTMMHEIGHSLGLGHTDSDPSIDSHKYSIMSYNLMAGMDPAGADNEVTPFGLQLLDIAAIQHLYGTNWDTRSGDTTYSKMTAFDSDRPNDAFIYTIWDGEGNDTIDASGYFTRAIINLNEGAFSSIGFDPNFGDAVDNVAIAYKAEIENAIGTSRNDTIIGNDLANEITGNNGDDILIGGEGNDIIYGGGDEDTITGGAGDDELHGGADNDTFIYNLGDGHDTIKNAVSNGDDTLQFGTGINSVNTTSEKVGDDFIITVSDGGTIAFEDYFANQTETTAEIEFSDANTLTLKSGTDFDDFISGGSGFDWLYGGAGNDHMSLNGYGAGSSRAYGGSGDDTLFASAGGGFQHYLYGQDGDDTFNFTGSGGSNYGTITAYGGIGNDFFGSITSIVDVNIYGEGGNDIITVDNDSALIEYNAYGGSGNDTYTRAGLRGVDAEVTTLHESSGIDSLYFRADLDLVDFGFTKDNLDLIIVEAANGNEAITIANYFASDNNKIEFIHTDDGDKTFDLISITDSLFGVTLQGTSGNDIINGTSNEELIIGSLGDDVIDGGTGVDTIDYSNASNAVNVSLLNGTATGSGNDTITNVENILGSDYDDYLQGHNAFSSTINGGAGNDTILGQDGDDILYGGTGNDHITGFGGDDTAYGEDGNDTLIGSGGNDILDGGAGADDLKGRDGDDTLRGGAGNDLIRGENGNDILYGDDGADFLWGGAGNDTIVGSGSRDWLRGEAGADTFVFESSTAFNDLDFLKDFSITDNDVLDLSDVLIGYDPLTDAISDFVAFTDNGTHSFLRVDADGAANGTDFTNIIARIDNVTGLDETTLETNGNLIGA